MSNTHTIILSPPNNRQRVIINKQCKWICLCGRLCSLTIVRILRPVVLLANWRAALQRRQTHKFNIAICKLHLFRGNLYGGAGLYCWYYKSFWCRYLIYMIDTRYCSSSVSNTSVAGVRRYHSCRRRLVSNDVSFLKCQCPPPCSVSYIHAQ